MARKLRRKRNCNITKSECNYRVKYVKWKCKDTELYCPVTPRRTHVDTNLPLRSSRNYLEGLVKQVKDMIDTRSDPKSLFALPEKVRYQLGHTSRVVLLAFALGVSMDQNGSSPNSLEVEIRIKTVRHLPLAVEPLIKVKVE